MDRRTIEHIFARNRELLPRKYAQLPPGGDIHLTAGFILEGDAPPESVTIAALPHMDKHDLVRAIRLILQTAIEDPPPLPIAGVVMISPSWQLDDQTRERIGELVTIEVEGEDGKYGQQLFDVKRTDAGNELVLRIEEIYEEDHRSEGELGTLQGFYPRNRNTTRH